MKEVKIKLTVDSKEAKQGMDNVTKSTKKLDKEVGEVSKSSANLGGSIDTMTGGAVSAFKKFAGGLKTVALGFRGIGGAIAASGIGLIVVTIAAVTAAFKGSEEGQNKFAKIMGVIGALTGVLVDRLAAFGTAVMDAFTNPVEAIKGMGTAVKEFVMDKIELLIDGLGLLGGAIKKAFSGDFSGALTDAKDGMIKIVRATNPAVMAAEALAKATASVVKEMTAEAKIAGQIADQRATADKLDRALIVDRADANRKRAELLDKAVNKELFSVKERIAFLTEAGEIEDEITKKEITASKLRLQAKQAENALGGSTKEDLDEEANLKAKLIDLETAKLLKSKAVTTQIAALNNEARADEKAIIDKIKADNEAEDAAEITRLKEAADLKKQLADYNAITEEELRERVREKLNEEHIALIEKLGEDNDAKLEVERAYLAKLKALNDGYIATDEATAKATAAQTKATDKAVADTKKSIQDETIGNATNGLKALAALDEENKGLQAAVLIADNVVSAAKVIQNTSIANTRAQAELGPVAGSAFAITNTIAAGLSIAANVAATAKGLAALGKGGGGGAPTPEASGATAPSFNLVEGSEGNAIQQSITGQENAIKAFVVSGDVTTAQSADRRIIEGSGF
jgi:hypothetical protein